MKEADTEIAKTNMLLLLPNLLSARQQIAVLPPAAAAAAPAPACPVSGLPGGCSSCNFKISTSNLCFSSSSACNLAEEKGTAAAGLAGAACCLPSSWPVLSLTASLPSLLPFSCSAPSLLLISSEAAAAAAALAAAAASAASAAAGAAGAAV